MINIMISIMIIIILWLVFSSSSYYYYYDYIIIYAFAKYYHNRLVLRQKIICPQRLLLPIHWWRQVLKNHPNVNFYNSSGANVIIRMTMITNIECFEKDLKRSFDVQWIHLIWYESYNFPLLWSSLFISASKVLLRWVIQITRGDYFYFRTVF